MHAILVHGWKGWPENAWFPWLRQELEARGWTTESLELPNPLLPKRAEWVRMVLDRIQSSDTVLIGHSLGCLAILHALKEYDGPPMAKVVFVSGFYRPFLPMRSFRNEWLPEALDMDAIRTKARSWVVIHAKLDPLVPFAEGKTLAKALDVPLIIPKRIGHLTHQEGAHEVPEILSATLDV